MLIYVFSVVLFAKKYLDKKKNQIQPHYPFKSIQGEIIVLGFLNVSYVNINVKLIQGEIIEGFF